MKQFILLVSLTIFLSGCWDANQVSNEDLAEYEVKQTFDEQAEDDFLFRLVSEKEAYEQGEEIGLYGEINYTGVEESLSISHAASAVFFHITEHVRGYDISFTVPEVGLQTEIFPNEPYREEYDKQFVFASESDSREYAKFIERFRNEVGFPAGYYTVEATTAFFDGSSHIRIKAEVDFKVLAEKSGN